MKKRTGFVYENHFYLGNTVFFKILGNVSDFCLHKIIKEF